MLADLKNDYEDDMQHVLDPSFIILKRKIKTFDVSQEQHYNFLKSLLKFNSLDELERNIHPLYLGSSHNFSASKFHELCDNKGPTLILIRSTTKSLFGGFSSRSWSSKNIFFPAPGSFLFSLSKQTKHILYRDEDKAMGGFRDKGPTFGDGHEVIDLGLSDKCEGNKLSEDNLGNGYSLPNHVQFGSEEAKGFLAGEEKFQVEEYEVFAVRQSQKKE